MKERRFIEAFYKVIYIKVGVLRRVVHVDRGNRSACPVPKLSLKRRANPEPLSPSTNKQYKTKDKKKSRCRPFPRRMSLM